MIERRSRCALAFVAALMLYLPEAQSTSAQEAPVRGPVTNLPMPRFVSIRAKTANARRGPDLNQRIDWAFVRRGLPVEVTDEYGHWRRVRDAEGAGGWVHYSLLSGVRMALVRADAPVPLYAGPDEQKPLVAMAEPGAVARISICAGDWCELTAGGIKGWLPRAAIWGVGPQEELD